MKPELSLTIPIYNEEGGIEETIKSLIKEFDKEKLNYELVLVNHGSIDNTHKILDELAIKNERLKVHNLPKNLGYGGGIQYGFENSLGKYIGFTCADEEILPEDVYRIFKIHLEKNYDVSKALRTYRKDGIIRKITTLIFNTLSNIRFNLKLKDINGYPIFMKREIYPEVMSKTTEYLWNLEFLRNIKKRGYKIIEVPVIHQKRKTGESFMSPFRIINMAWRLIKYSI